MKLHRTDCRVRDGREQTARRALGRHLGLLLFVTLACGALLITQHAAEPAAPRPHQVKAAFIHNFSKFVEWPPASFRSGGDAMRLGVLGVDPFGPDLEAVLGPNTIDGRRWAVQRSAEVEGLKECHVIFICPSEAERLPKIFSEIATLPILTVSEFPDPGGRGAIINFVLEGKRVRFDVDRAAAARAGLGLNAQMLRLARTTIDGGAR